MTASGVTARRDGTNSKEIDMATVKIKGIVHKDSWGDGFSFFVGDMSKHGYIPVGPHEIDYEVPADFNPVAAEVASLEKQIETISGEHMITVKRIRGRIAELQCIENSATVPA
jgi:hypothetical protein